MKCDECGRVINNPIVERAVYGIATYFNCEKCFNSKYLNDNGIRESSTQISVRGDDEWSNDYILKTSKRL